VRPCAKTSAGVTKDRPTQRPLSPARASLPGRRRRDRITHSRRAAPCRTRNSRAKVTPPQRILRGRVPQKVLVDTKAKRDTRASPGCQGPYPLRLPGLVAPPDNSLARVSPKPPALGAATASWAPARWRLGASVGSADYGRRTWLWDGARALAILLAGFHGVDPGWLSDHARGAYPHHPTVRAPRSFHPGGLR